MNIEKKWIDSVNSKLNQQNAIYAALGAASWTIPTLALWYFVFSLNPSFGVMMFLLSGCIIGLCVRYHGKGMKPLFSIIALITYIWIAAIAYIMGIVLHGTTWAIFLVGMFAAGGWLAMYLAKKEVPFEEHLAHTHLTSLQNHESESTKKNKWFIAIPLLLLTISGSSYLAIMGVYIAEESQQQNQVIKQESTLKQREIDISALGLDSLKTKEILRYSYAYHSGLLFDKNGKYTQPFPRSEYKAKTVLKYLVNQRDNARAMYILGILSSDDLSFSLIKRASEAGDQYAQIHSYVKYGCHTDADIAIDLLSKQNSLSHKKNIKEEISSILYIGFPEICGDFVRPEYVPSYILNYSRDN
jgi:hypothetical protein